MKNNLFRKFLAVFLTGTLLGAVGCKDYDDDINDLQKQIDETNASVSELKALIESGSVIKSVTKTNNGLSFTLSNNQTYEVTNGTNGTNADVWTIGADGYWYKNDVKQSYKAVGVDGVKGDKGDKGDTGDKGDARCRRKVLCSRRQRILRNLAGRPEGRRHADCVESCRLGPHRTSSAVIR